MPTPASRSEEVRIPISSSSTTAGTAGSSSSYDVSQLDENNDVFGSSQASSVTVMSEQDRHSLLLSPYASPVNNQDTPTIRTLTHPFGISGGSAQQQRTTPLSLVSSPSSCDSRVMMTMKGGSQSESDSIDSLPIRGSEAAANFTGGSGSGGGRYLKKAPALGNNAGGQFCDPIGSSSIQPLVGMRKSSPLLSSSRQTGMTSCSQQHQREGLNDKAPPTDSAPSSLAADRHTHFRCNCHYGNPTTCATIASCESMGMCPIEDGFLTFNPSRKSRNGVMSMGVEPLLPRHAHFHVGSVESQRELEDDYSLSHLASCGLLGPAPSSLDSTHSSSVAAPPPSSLSRSHTACSSLDSGYDHSLSLTNSSSRDSVPEFLVGSFVMVGSNKNPVPAGGVAVGGRSDDSGWGSSCSCPCPKEKGGCRRTLFPVPPAFQDVHNTDVSSHFSSLKNSSGGTVGMARATPTSVAMETTAAAVTDGRTGQQHSSVCYPQDGSQYSGHTSPSSSGYKVMSASRVVPDHAHLNPDQAYEVVKVTPARTEGSTAPATANQTPTKANNPPTLSADPTNSLFPMRLTNFEPPGGISASCEELSSPLMPECLDEKQMRATSSLQGEVPPLLRPPAVVSMRGRLSADATKSLPGARKFKHIRTIEDSRAASTRRNNVNAASSDFVGLEHPSPAPSIPGHAHGPSPSLPGRSEDENSLSSVSISGFSSKEEEEDSSIPTFGSNLNTSSVPVTRSPHATPSSSLRPSSASLNAPPRASATKGGAPAGGSCCPSICSEADSGRGTKSSMKTTGDDFNSNSLSQISEMSSSYSELESDCGQDSLSVPFPYCYHHQRASSTPPTLVAGSKVNREEEEGACLGGGAYHSSFTSLSQSKLLCCDSNSGNCKLPAESSKYRFDGSAAAAANNMADRLPLMSLKAYRNNPSALHQQLHEHDQSLMRGVRPTTLEQFDNFTDVPLPNLDDFHLDTPSTTSSALRGGGIGRGVAGSGMRDDSTTTSHRQQMSDFGHSLFVG